MVEDSRLRNVVKNKDMFKKLLDNTDKIKDNEKQKIMEVLVARLNSLSFNEVKSDIECKDLKTELFGDRDRGIKGTLKHIYFKDLPWYPVLISYMKETEKRISLYDEEYNILLDFAVKVAEVWASD